MLEEKSLILACGLGYWVIRPHFFLCCLDFRGTLSLFLFAGKTSITFRTHKIFLCWCRLICYWWSCRLLANVTKLPYVSYDNYYAIQLWIIYANVVSMSNLPIIQLGGVMAPLHPWSILLPTLLWCQSSQAMAADCCVLCCETLWPVPMILFSDARYWPAKHISVSSVRPL